jgi:hypothetical protein
MGYFSDHFGGWIIRNGKIYKMRLLAKPPMTRARLFWVFLYGYGKG